MIYLQKKETFTNKKRVSIKKQKIEIIFLK